MGLTTRNYDILTRIGVGNGALVYRAVDKVTHRQVALKLLVQDGNVDRHFHAEPLLADAPRLAKISGTHICQLIEAFHDEDGPVLVYEFAQGVNGAGFFQKQKPDAAQAVDIAAQLISALRSGERQRRPHGDVKPSNLILMELADRRPFVLVLDWALTSYRAVAADDSLPYLAPERLHGAGATHRADLFSAGATLFFLCTGTTLIAAKTIAEAESGWKAATPAVLAELRPDLPAKFVQWLGSLVDLSPEKRPASAVEALASLAALNPPPPPVPPESFRARSSLPIASGIVAPPPGNAMPGSAIRELPPASAIRPAPEKADAKPAAVPVKNSHVAMTIGLFLGLVIMIAGSVWFFFLRKDEPVKYPGDTADPLARPTAAARTPPPSVGENIGKKFAPPPVTAVPGQKPAQPAPAKSPKPKATPKPAAKPPAPTPVAPAPPPEAK